MKIENIHRAAKLGEQIKILNRELQILTVLCDKYTSDSDGNQGTHSNSICTIHLTQFGDGSGFHVDLTGLQVGVKLLNYTKQLLEEKREDIHRQIAEL